MSVANFLRPDQWLESGTGPRYVRLRQRIQDAIDAKILTPDAPLPAEREIATLTGLSRVTVRKAMQDLVSKGVIVQRQGSGNFITTRGPRMEQSLSVLTSFTEDMKRRGYISEARWLERGVFMPSPDEIVSLSLSADDSVARIARLRTANDRPLAIERASLPLDILPNPLLVETSLYELLDADGNRPVRAIQKISAINLDTSDADLLEVEPGSAGLRIERLSRLTSGRVIELTRSIYRGDAYEFVAELRLTENQETK